MCVTEIWDKIFSANQIAEVLNQLFPQKKSVKQSHFFWFDTEVLKVDQKNLFGHGQKWLQPFWFLDSKIDCILRLNRWN